MNDPKESTNATEEVPEMEQNKGTCFSSYVNLKENNENTNEQNNEEKDELLLQAYRQKYAKLDVENVSDVLYKYFPFPEMKKEQKECLCGLKNFQHVLNIMPTGGGKSLVYQLVPLLIDGISIVISPLISLIQDQVASLNRRNIVAVSIHSSVSKKENEKILNQLRDGAEMNIQILYATPETATKDPLLTIIKTLYRQNRISLIAIDEAHCISTWGCQFRKSYRNLNVILNSCPFVRVYACTATATKQVERDIVMNLGIGKNFGKENKEKGNFKSDSTDPQENCLRVVRCSFNRPNLKYIVIYTDYMKEEEKNMRVYKIIQGKKNIGKTGIIYCFKRKTCEFISKYMRDKGTHALCYHAGLSATARKKAQEKWISGKATVLVATIAFGMGIDRQNVSYIIHYNLPKSIENYYQESGRAGRNGNIAYCYLFFSTVEVSKMATIIKLGNSNMGMYGDESHQNVEKELYDLECVNNLCLTDKCIRSQILMHFGETYYPLPPKNETKQITKGSTVEQDEDTYCCSFCDNPCETKKYIHNCKQKLKPYRDDSDWGDSYQENNYESEYGYDSDENLMDSYKKKKKYIYEVPSIYKKKTSKYDPAYCYDTSPYSKESFSPKKNNFFSIPDEPLLHKKFEINKSRGNDTSGTKKYTLTKQNWEGNKNSTFTENIGKTQFKSASTIIPIDTQDTKPHLGSNELKNKRKQNKPIKKHEYGSITPYLHPMKKVKKTNATEDFVAPRPLNDSK